MQNQSRTILKYSISILTIFFIYKVSGEMSSNLRRNARLYEISKRNLLSKEREYLKSNPLSNELRSFINRYKRRTKHIVKRDDEKLIDKEHMYVVKDGEIVPFSEMNNSSKVLDVKFTNGLDDKFTVLPLIVPVTVSKVETKPKCDENSSSTEEETTQTTTTTSERTEKNASNINDNINLSY